LNFDEINAKIQAQTEYQSRTQTPVSDMQSCGEYRRPSLREEAEKSVGYHRLEAEKQDRAAAFFRENPSFDEFIQLIRAGAIQI